MSTAVSGPHPERPRSPMEVFMAVSAQVMNAYYLAAVHDPLTGLPNKIGWSLDIEQRIESKQAFGIQFMDMNAFKLVNDKLGHDVGDELLQSFGLFLAEKFRRPGDLVGHERIMQIMNGSKAVSRWAGDEFVTTHDLSDNERRGVEEETGRRKTPKERMADQESYLREVIAEFVAMQPDEIKALGFDVSVGSAYWTPDEPISADALFKLVDRRMQECKAEAKQQAYDAAPRYRKTASWLIRKLEKYAVANSKR